MIWGFKIKETTSNILNDIKRSKYLTKSLNAGT